MQTRAEIFKSFVKQLHIGDVLKGTYAYSYQPKDSHTEEIEVTVTSLSENEVVVTLPEVNNYRRELGIKHRNIFYIDNNFHIIIQDYLMDSLYIFVIPNQYL